MNPFAGIGQDLKERPGHAYVQSVAKDRIKVERRPVIKRPKVANPWKLRPSQCEVMGWLVQGFMNQEIAMEMDLSIRTVESHVLDCLASMTAREGRRINRVSAAVIWDRFIRSEQQ